MKRLPRRRRALTRFRVRCGTAIEPLEPRQLLAAEPGGFSGVGSQDDSLDDGRSINPCDAVVVARNADHFPDPVDDVFELAEDSSLVVGPGEGVLRNDPDSELDRLTALLDVTVAHGELQFQPDGSFQYQPNAGYYGTDLFTYRLGNGNQFSRAAEVHLQIVPNNDLPVVADDQYFLPPSQTFAVTAGLGVLANDSDNEGAALKASLLERPRHGSVELALDGSFTFVPESGFVGSDRFTYRASDAVGGHADATVQLRVAAEQIIISEFAAINTGAVLDYFDESSDWIELKNVGPAAVDLKGWYITDDLSNLTKWQVPVSSILGRDEYLLVFASGRNRLANNGELHTNFRLSSAGEELALVHSDGKTIAWTPGTVFPTQARGISFGHAPSRRAHLLISTEEHSRVLVPTDSALDTAWMEPDFDDSNWQIHGSGLGFAETPPDQQVRGFSVRMVELNRTRGGSIESAEIAAKVLRGDFAPEEFVIDQDITTVEPQIHFGPRRLTFPNPRPYPNGESSYKLSDFVVAAQTTATIPAGDWSIGFGSGDGGRLRLGGVSFLETFNENGMAVSGDGEIIFNETRKFDWTWATFSVGPGGLTTSFDSFFFERDGTDSFDVAIAAGHQTTEPTDGKWTLLDDRALGWRLLADYTPPIANFANLVGADLASKMHGRSTSAYVRIPFGVADPRQFDRLLLTVQRDDAFVAYLNGQEIARDNVTGIPGWASVADSDLADDVQPVFQTFDVSQHLALLEPGKNVLGLHGINTDLADNEFLLISELTAIDDLASAAVFMEQSTPGEANQAGAQTVLSPPTLSHPGGLIEGKIILELEHESPKVAVRYTVDGTIPVADSPRYTLPIEILETTQVRARAFSPHHIASDIPSKTVSGLYVVTASETRKFTSNLPILVLDTYGSQVPSTNSSIRADTAALLFDLSRDGQSALANKPDLITRAGVRARGSSSGGAAKVPMTMELRRDDSEEDRDVSLLGMPLESDWILQGPYYFDRSLNRNALIFELSNQVGQYAARTRYVEVFLNSDNGQLSDADYFGVYLLMEKLKSGPDRIQADQVYSGATTAPDLTGGYVFKTDRRDPGDQGFMVDGLRMSYVEPKEEDIVKRPEQVGYLTQYLMDFSAALKALDFVHPTLGSHYTDYIDEQSWVDYYLLNELMLNVDALRLSAYWHKPRNAELIAGPLWDFDRSAESIDSRDDRPTTWYRDIQAIPWWWVRIFDDLEFRQAYIDRWQELRGGPLSTESINRAIDRMASEVGSAADRNFQRWPEVAPRSESTVFDSGSLDGTFEGELKHQKEWLRQRVEYFDNQFLPRPGLSNPGGVFTESLTIELMPTKGTLLYFTTDGSEPRLPGGGINGQAKLVGDVVTYVNAESAATVLIPTGAASETGWQQTDFNDVSWLPSEAGIGFDTGVNEFVSVESGFTVRQAHSTKRVRNLAGAEDVLAGIDVETETLATDVSVLNFKGLGGDGHFLEGNVSFPDGGDSDFGLVAMATIVVERPGLYTFGVNSDDGSRLRIGGQDVIVDNRRHQARDVFGTIELAAGHHELELVMFQTGGTANLELFAAPGERTEFDASFALVGDDLSNSYEAQFNTDVRTTMHNVNSAAYVRVPFAVSNTRDVRRLFLKMQYDDAFAAFINGVEVLRVDTPAALGHDSRAIDVRADNAATRHRTFEITEFAHLLKTGDNLLALHGLNAAVDDPDFLLVPELSGFVVPDSLSLTLVEDTRLVMRSFDPTFNVPDISSFQTVQNDNESWSGAVLADFRIIATTPAESLRVTELHYNPENEDDLEFLEFQNVSNSSSLDLKGVQIVGPFDEDFDFSNSQVKSLGPKGTVLVVRDRDAFTSAYPELTSLVAGQYLGALSNGGEQLAVVDLNGQTVLQVTYDDAWYPETDGGGSSLEVVDPAAVDLSFWSRKEGWKPSRSPLGSPGIVESPSPPVVGDVNRDGMFDQQDLVWVFAGGKYEDDVADNASYEDGDWDGDGDFTSQDLVFAFTQGHFIPAVGEMLF